MFWLLALLWLPAGLVLFAALQGAVPPLPMMTPEQALMFAITSPCGLFLFCGCRWLHRLGWRRTAWGLGIALAPLSALVFARIGGLLGSAGIIAFTAFGSLPVWAMAGTVRCARAWRARGAGAGR